MPTTPDTTKYSHIDHYHCWLHGKDAPCGIPIEKHTQCCLCDLPTPDNKRECCEECEYDSILGIPPIYCLQKNCPCHKKEISKCCGAERGGYDPKNGSLNTDCSNCGEVFIPQSQDTFVQKTLAELYSRADQYIFDAINLRKTEDEPELLQKHRDFLRSALNAQREDIQKEEITKINDFFRSMASIAERKGERTNWEPFIITLNRELDRQHKIMYPDRYLFPNNKECKFCGHIHELKGSSCEKLIIKENGKSN